MTQSNKSLVTKAVEDNREKIITLSDQVFEYAETGFREFRSAALFKEMLENEGFTVTTGISQMPTAFSASFGFGKPVIGLLAEYDALPGLGQLGGATTHTVPEHNPDGHGCGHNLLGAGTFAAALALKEYLTENPGKGTVILFGCPSEEKGNGKTLMARDGVFKDVDAALTWHPADRNYVASCSSLANISVYFDFKGTTAHAAAAPHLGRSALDAAELMSVGVNYLREHVIPEARIHYAYINVGGIAPNVVQGESRVHYFIRAPKTHQVLDIFERIKDIARGAALMTGTASSFEVFSGLSDCVPNRTLSQVLYESMLEVGAPDFTEEDFSTAAAFFEESYPQQIIEKKKEELIREFGEETGTYLAAHPLDTKIPPINWNLPVLPGSTDVGDVSHVIPTAQCSYATCALGTALHTWQATAHGNTGIAHKAVLAAGKALALTAIRVMEDEKIQKDMKEDWKNDTGGRYICPISDDIKPRLED